MGRTLEALLCFPERTTLGQALGDSLDPAWIRSLRHQGLWEVRLRTDGLFHLTDQSVLCRLVTHTKSRA